MRSQVRAFLRLSVILRTLRISVYTDLGICEQESDNFLKENKEAAFHYNTHNRQLSI